MCFFLSHSFVTLVVCFGSLTCWNTHHWPNFCIQTEARRFSLKISLYLDSSIFPSTWCSRSIPLEEKQPQSIMFPPPCLMIGMVFLGSKWTFFLPNTASGVDAKKLNSTFSQTSSESSRCSFTNFRWACTCTFLSRGTLWAEYDFSPRWHRVLIMVILVNVVPAALRSSTSFCHIILGCSLTLLIIRFIPCWEILCGTPDQGRLIVNWCFFHFLIIASRVDSFSLSCLPIILKPIPVLCRYTILSRMSLDNSFILPLVGRFDSDSVNDSVNKCLF